MSYEFWPRVDKLGDGDECWLWTGPLDRNGYGLYAPARAVSVRAHRFAFTAEYGADALPPGVPLDHTCHDPLACSWGDVCHHRRCVRPDHLVVSSPGENAARTAKAMQEACLHGHPFDEANTYRKPNGTRACRRCRADREKGRRLRAKA